MENQLQKRLDALIGTLEYRPGLLLHSCCAPCSSYVLEYLAPHFNITLLYYNPNILPAEEYAKRLKEQERLLREMPAATSVKLIAGEYDTQSFLREIFGLEGEEEGGGRCAACFRLRLGRAAEQAVQSGCEYVGTTLSVSPHKNAALLDEILCEAAENSGVKPLPADFKKKGGYQRSLVLSKEYHLYRQAFCGCPFSQR